MQEQGFASTLETKIQAKEKCRFRCKFVDLISNEQSFKAIEREFGELIEKRIFDSFCNRFKEVAVGAKYQNIVYSTCEWLTIVADFLHSSTPKTVLQRSRNQNLTFTTSFVFYFYFLGSTLTNLP